MSESNVVKLSDNKVADEVAEAEFDRFLDCMDIDAGLRGMDDEDRAAFFESKRRFLRAVKNGSLVVNENGEPVFTPVKSDNTNPITFREPEGAHLMQADTKKKDHAVTKFYAMMAGLTGESVQRFAKMKQRDLAVCQAIALILLG